MEVSEEIIQAAMVSEITMELTADSETEPETEDLEIQTE